MKSVGLIVEYNPFHNGHKYHLEHAKKNGEVVIAVMSGDFVQRGEPSVIDRWTKTKLALENGVDLVVELPSFYSTQSAEIFAKGGVGILNELKVDSILFGSESNDLEELYRISQFQESQEFQDLLKASLDKGNSYPTAHSQTMQKILGETRLGSNDILGLEYLKAIKYWGSSITPILLKREKTGYHDQNIVEDFASATMIRSYLKEKKDISNIVPKASFEILKDYSNFTYIGDFYPLMRYELFKNIKNLSNIQDMEVGFENRLYENALKNLNYEDFYAGILNKRYTQGRTQRVLLHSILGLTTEITSLVKKEVPYVRVLGFNLIGQKYLTYLKQFKNPKIITSYKKMNNIFSKEVCELIEFNELASNIYKLVNPYKEYKSPIILKGEDYE